MAPIPVRGRSRKLRIPPLNVAPFFEASFPTKSVVSARSTWDWTQLQFSPGFTKVHSHQCYSLQILLLARLMDGPTVGAVGIEHPVLNERETIARVSIGRVNHVFNFENILAVLRANAVHDQNVVRTRHGEKRHRVDPQFRHFRSGLFQTSRSGIANQT